MKRFIVLSGIFASGLAAGMMTDVVGYGESRGGVSARVSGVDVSGIGIFGAALAQTPPQPERAADDPAPVCDPPYEALVELKPSRLGFYTVWDAVYGKTDKMVQLFSGISLPHGTVLAWGRVMSADGEKVESLVVGEINRRGFVGREKLFTARPDERPVRIAALPEKGYVAVSNLAGGDGQNQRIHVLYLNDDLEITADRILRDDTYHYKAADIVATPDGKGFMLVAQATHRKNENDQYAVLMRYSADGKQVWKRSYRSGSPQTIRSLVPVGDDRYLALGHVSLDNRRQAAQVFMLDGDGVIVWQKSYQRGRAAYFTGAAPWRDTVRNITGYYLLGGITPYGDGPGATWLFSVDSTGAPLWQRYMHRSDVGFEPVGLSRDEKDGRLTVALNVKNGAEGGYSDHVRLLGLSPRGDLLNDEGYVKGLQATGYQLLAGWKGERVVLATSLSDIKPIAIDKVEGDFVVKDSQVHDAAEIPHRDPMASGWVVVATPPEEYTDPCLPKRRIP